MRVEQKNTARSGAVLGARYRGMGPAIGHIKFSARQKSPIMLAGALHVTEFYTQQQVSQPVRITQSVNQRWRTCDQEALRLCVWSEPTMLLHPARCLCLAVEV